MTANCFNVLTRTGLKETDAKFPKDVREALALALKLVAQIKNQLTYGEEPSHIFQATRSLEAEAEDSGSWMTNFAFSALPRQAERLPPRNYHRSN